MMGSNILEGVSEFMKVIKIFDNHSKERRVDRLPRRERSFTISGSRVSRKISEEF